MTSAPIEACEVELLALLGNYDRPTDPLTDGRLRNLAYVHVTTFKLTHKNEKLTNKHTHTHKHK